MKLFALFFISTVLLFGCTGECLSCHPSLVPTIKDDLRHAPMLGCVKCHMPKSDSMAECGADCFACHSMKKINAAGVAEHGVIQGCKDCHMQMKNSLPAMGKVEQSQRETLQDFLKLKHD